MNNVLALGSAVLGWLGGGWRSVAGDPPTNTERPEGMTAALSFHATARSQSKGVWSPKITTSPHPQAMAEELTLGTPGGVLPPAISRLSCSKLRRLVLRLCWLANTFDSQGSALLLLAAVPDART